MKKKRISWIPAGLFTIITTIATIYCLLQYRESVLIIGIASLLLLFSAFWLFTCITRISLEKERAANDVGKEQRERMNYEGMKLQGEELIRLVNNFGKGIYVYNKRTSECMQALFDHTIQTQQANEQLVNLLMQNQTKTAKFQVKYGQEDTSRLLAAMKDNYEKLNQNLEQSIAALQAGEPASEGTDPAILNYLNELSGKLAEINASVQSLQTQLDEISEKAATPVVITAPQPEAVNVNAPSAETTDPVLDTIEELLEQVTSDSPVAEATEPVAEVPEPAVVEEPVVNVAEAPEPVVAESPAANVAETPEPVVAEAPAANVVETPEPVAAAPVEEPAPVAEPVVEATTATPVEATAATVTETTATAAAPVVEEAPAKPAMPDLSGDPNKQLSPDEIAALFASLG